ncbi:hypothetical protein ParaKuw1_00019 [Paracoccus phage ParKuw1]|uniref:Uncharacterized protein n=1 Tax=Paracoccus phage ParKuw1 TaxID=3032415 RepID=A0AAF0FF68_9CAUD|nr:hypothetical protein ParaKuw1_00019 [Paracoccus phage ParKuw1]
MVLSPTSIRIRCSQAQFDCPLPHLAPSWSTVGRAQGCSSAPEGVTYACALVMVTLSARLPATTSLQSSTYPSLNSLWTMNCIASYGMSGSTPVVYACGSTVCSLGKPPLRVESLLRATAGPVVVLVDGWTVRTPTWVERSVPGGQTAPALATCQCTGTSLSMRDLLRRSESLAGSLRGSRLPSVGITLRSP